MSSQQIAGLLSPELIQNPGDWQCRADQAQKKSHACRWRGKRVSVHLTASWDARMRISRPQAAMELGLANGRRLSQPTVDPERES
ncbi:MAG: hypothetical protein VX035_10195 [Planctomycetota bacterium]|nr:hypothetical protein [Planctomycetota bacterium]